jgi:hypothetical protein
VSQHLCKLKEMSVKNNGGDEKAWKEELIRRQKEDEKWDAQKKALEEEIEKINSEQEELRERMREVDKRILEDTLNKQRKRTSSRRNHRN